MNIYQTKDFEKIAVLNEAVQKVHAEAYPEYFKEYRYEEIKEFFEEIISKPHHTFFILEDEGNTIGYAWIEIKHYPENPFKKEYKSLLVHQLSIEAHVRGKGYGTFFMKELFRFAADHHLSRVELDYWHNNNMARSFYEKQGFTVFREYVYKEVD
ncbi:GNAT family N-acetyltransferase [Rossellomorea sp. NS-SX7]|uniref:GNAT family N-acetyltransferase n=1 Tax=Rossellomorea sp. NS-SX7 TaxID=3463856 RepID=UPI004059461A